MNRAIRNTVALFLGIVLCGFVSYSYAANWTGGGIVQRSGGLTSDLKLPANSAGVQIESGSDFFRLIQDGTWTPIDPKGNQVRVPGRDTLTIPKDAIDKAAAGTAIRGAGRLGGIPGIILSALAAEAITRGADGLLKKTTEEPVPWKWKYLDSQGTVYESAQEYANAACARSAQGFWYNVRLDRATASESTSGWRSAYVMCQQYSDVTHTYTTWDNWSQNATRLCPSGVVAIGDDCGTAAKTADATQKDIEDAVAKRTAMADAALKDYYDAIDAQGKKDLVPSTKIQHKVTPTVGPPSTSTTVAPDGSTTTTTTQSTYTGTESGSNVGNHVVNITNTTTTNVTNNGNTTTTTTTEAANSPAPTKSACQENPNAVGCQELGEVPDVDLERKELEGSVVPVSVGGEGQCPAPLTANVGGQQVEMTFEPVCRVATGVRPVVIVVAWLAAAYILAGVVRGES